MRLFTQQHGHLSVPDAFFNVHQSLGCRYRHCLDQVLSWDIPVLLQTADNERFPWLWENEWLSLLLRCLQASGCCHTSSALSVLLQLWKNNISCRTDRTSCFHTLKLNIEPQRRRFSLPTRKNRNAAFFMPSCYVVGAKRTLIYAASRAQNREARERYLSSQNTRSTA